jgi:hypothetical protein
MPQSHEQSRPGLVQLAQVLPGGEKRVLCQVFAVAAAAGGAISEGANQRLVAGDDQAKGLTVTRKAMLNKLGVVTIGGGNGDRCHGVTA